jgi:uncharacterized repeat protein (TIGR03803 family)
MRIPFVALMIAIAMSLIVSGSGLAVPALSNVFTFAADGSQGELPNGGVVQGTDGTYYGTAEMGGANNLGVVFKVNHDGTGFLIIHQFAGGAQDGAEPKAGLIFGQDGKLYGTTTQGGTNGVGTVFVIGTDGNGFQVLHSFTSATDGDTPSANLVQGADGFLYGTAMFSGPNFDGTLFRMATDGSQFYEMHSFSAGLDGSNPVGLSQGSDGNLYGVANLGGTNSDGVVYRVAPNDGHFQVVHSFVGTDGNDPVGGVFQATDGNLYGTTSDFASISGGNGTIFEVAPDGSNFNTLHSFTGPDGLMPDSALVEGTDGNLYGTATMGGTNNVGTVFDIAQGGGGFNTLGSFSFSTGFNPEFGLYLGDDGIFYGTAPGNNGNVFKVNEGLAAGPGSILAVAQPGGVLVTWSPVENALGYTLYTSTVPGAVLNGQASVLVGSQPSDVITTSTPGQTLYFQVTANVGGNPTAPSYEVSAMEQATPTVHIFPIGLQMISLPESYTDLNQAFGGASVALAAYSNGGYSVTPTAPANTMVNGAGYWVDTVSTLPANDTGLYPDCARPFPVALTVGWNLIGNPMPDAVAATDLNVKIGNTTDTFAQANQAGLVGPQFYTWQVGDSAYEISPYSTAMLAPFKGYWLYAFQACTLVFPSQPAP